MKLRYRIKEWLFKKFWPDEYEMCHSARWAKSNRLGECVLYDMTFDIIELHKE